MYTLGLSAAIFGGGDSIITIMMNAGLGLAGLIVIIFSTVTTTFMDAYSAGVSSTTIYKSASSKGIAVIVTIVGFHRCHSYIQWMILQTSYTSSALYLRR